MKKAKFPIEAAALGMILFSKNMLESLVVGILIIFSAQFADVLRKLLKNNVPEWSESISVLLLTGSVCASAFEWAYAMLGWERDVRLWLIHLVLGLLCARHVLWKGTEEERMVLLQSAGLWGLWIVFGIVREFCSFGTVAGMTAAQFSFQSPQFQHVMFGFLTAGFVLAFTNGIFKTRQQKQSETDTDALYVMLPTVCFVQPIVFSFTGEWLGIVLSVAVTLLFFYSIQKKIAFSRPGKAYRGLPIELMSMGFLYMILNVY